MQTCRQAGNHQEADQESFPNQLFVLRLPQTQGSHDKKPSAVGSSEEEKKGGRRGLGGERRH